ncbi:extracellular solute-binding protein [Paenibacillus sp. sptzw28]|uniref:ABC transporter substrate-binding protein n=1 Tax=Paenibacillus sp. sptzw28 TaxID=715179 RepID=UPI001C6E249F|nr:extracellular solute-binding protein [Paenibacillus sp. sptzw28]QYR22686.1 extracellular solute-binding protein [Paenibacillus sp. sptzw28]
MNDPVNEWERRLAGRPPIKNGFTSDLERKVRERIRMKQTNRTATFRAVAALLSVVILLGCGWWFRVDLKELLQPKKKEDNLAAIFNDPLADKEATLNVQLLTIGDFNQIKKPFIIRHPSVTINTFMISPETAYTPDKFLEAIDKGKPDLLMLPLGMYMRLAAEGKLKPLDPLIKKNNFDLGELHQPLVDLLRSAGGGELYGLTNQFNSTVLYVNEDLFEKHKIPIPEEGATLDEILKTAARFEGTGVYGLTSYRRDNPSQLAALIGQSTGMQAVSLTREGVKATVQTDGWKRVWQEVADGNKKGWIGQSPPLDWSKGSILMTDIFKSDLFASGKAAMIIEDNNYYGSLLDYEKTTKKQMNWMTLPYRIDPAATNQADYLNTMFVYAINAQTSDTEAAWELLRFIAGPETASRFDQGQMNSKMILSRAGAMKSEPSEKWGAFYKMEVDPQQVIANIKKQEDKRYQEAYQQFMQLSGEHMKAVIKGSETVDQALEKIQAGLDASLLKINNEEKKQ